MNYTVTHGFSNFYRGAYCSWEWTKGPIARKRSSNYQGHGWIPERFCKACHHHRELSSTFAELSSEELLSAIISVRACATVFTAQAANPWKSRELRAFAKAHAEADLKLAAHLEALFDAKVGACLKKEDAKEQVELDAE